MSVGAAWPRRAAAERARPSAPAAPRPSLDRPCRSAPRRPADSSLKGHVTIAVKVGSGGNVCGVSVASNDMGSPGVANCAANIFRSVGSYPAPKGGCVEATVPMSFVPQGQ
jgi:outer membrane biosynthesis protein TonB